MMNRRDSSKDTVRFLFYIFIFLVFIDIPNVILYTTARSDFLAKTILYSAELAMAIILVCLLVLPRPLPRYPAFVYVYAGYILLIMLMSLVYYSKYGVMKNSRKFLAPLPPLILGYYFSLSFRERGSREQYTGMIIKFITIMSIIGLVEWIWWYLTPYSSVTQFYSNYFRVGPYYANIRHTSSVTKELMLRASERTSISLIPGVTKRFTGLYLEPFSAGFNSTLGVILILYSKIAGYRKKRSAQIFLIINVIAVILTTNRSSYLLLSASLFFYAIINRSYLGVSLFFLLAFLYAPLRSMVAGSVTSLGGGYHEKAFWEFFEYFWANFASVKGFLGSGFGSMIGTQKWYLYVESGYGTIFLQLGILGLAMVFFLYLSVIVRAIPSKENRFFVLSISISTLALLFFQAPIFGYKSYGLIHFFLGTMIKHGKVADRIPHDEARSTSQTLGGKISLSPIE